MNNMRELGPYTVEAVRNTYHVDFTIYPVTGYIESKISPSHNHDPLVKGYIKWDGCSNWDFPIEEGITHPLHFCDQQEIQSFGKMLSDLYDWAIELMPEYENNIR